MTAQIYLVVSSGGRYEDAWTHVEHAWTNQLDADAHVARLYAQDTSDREIAELIKSFLAEYCVVTPPPVYPSYEGDQVYPRWAPGISEKDITAEMRAERHAIQAENTKRREEYQAGPYAVYEKEKREYNERTEEVLREYLITNGVLERYVNKYSQHFRAPDKHTYHEVESVNFN